MPSRGDFPAASLDDWLTRAPDMESVGGARDNEDERYDAEMREHGE